MLFVGILLSTPGCNNGTTPVFVDAPAEGLDGRADAKFQLLRRVLEQELVHLDAATCRSRLAVLVADGQYTQGESSSYNPIKVPQRFFTWIGRQYRSVWDSFHRVHKAGVKAMAKIDSCKHFFDTLKLIETAFGGGQGRLLTRAMAEEMGERFRANLVPGGTREFCYLASTPKRPALQI